MEREGEERERELFWWYVFRQSWRWNNEPTNRRGPCKSPGLAPPLSPLCATLPSARDGGRVLRGFRRSCRHSNCSHRQSLQLVLHTHGSGTRVSPVTAESSFWLCFLWSIGDPLFLLSTQFGVFSYFCPFFLEFFLGIALHSLSCNLWDF